VFHSNFGAYGVRKVWRQLLREGFSVEVILRRGPWRSFEAVEFATLEWVDWFNHRRLMGPIGQHPPAEAGQHYYYASLERSALVA
jgi:transposase InsO family protein